MVTTKKRINHNSKTKKNKKTNNDSGKLNIIFDIDATLVQTFFTRDDKANLMNIHPNSEYYIAKTKKSNFIIFIRNYAHILLRYCFEHFNVGVWSTGSTNYINEILQHLLPTELYNKLNVIITRDRLTDKELVCKDTKNNKTFKLSNFNGYY